MILILSESNDVSTLHICEWLSYWDVPYTRIDEDMECDLELITISNDENLDFVLKHANKKIALSDVKASWYRRGGLNIQPRIKSDYTGNSGLDRAIAQHLRDEKEILQKFFYYLLEKKPHIGKYSTRYMNKLKVLDKCRDLNINIPTTIIASRAENVSAQGLITKSISELFTYNSGKFNCWNYTESVNFDKNADFTFPSKFQKKIAKRADIRIFYLLNEFYGMAIMSQENERTALDFRRYDEEDPNRFLPYEIDAVTKEKLGKLMDALELQTGSIDMILTTSGDLVFLEVNPVGQFNMTSVPCNYNLEKIIAQKLTQLAGYETRN